MTTKLSKPVRRLTETTRRERGKSRAFVVSLCPGDMIGFRFAGCKREEFLPVGVAYNMAVRLRIATDKEAKRKNRLVKRGKI